MTVLATHAAWVLVITFAISVLYEIWRATAKAGTSEYDSPKALLQQLVLYVVAVAVIAALFAQAAWAVWAGLVFCVVMILVSVLYYNPVIMLDRQPGIIDWIEDLLFTGLLFVAATMLLYEVLGWELGQ
jgi:Na+-translocating ferredoxin:NAD+ oxidoreductase RnfD subunit